MPALRVCDREHLLLPDHNSQHCPMLIFVLHRQGSWCFLPGGSTRVCLSETKLPILPFARRPPFTQSCVPTTSLESSPTETARIKLASGDKINPCPLMFDFLQSQILNDPCSRVSHSPSNKILWVLGQFLLRISPRILISQGCWIIPTWTWVSYGTGGLFKSTSLASWGLDLLATADEKKPLFLGSKG